MRTQLIKALQVDPSEAVSVQSFLGKVSFLMKFLYSSPLCCALTVQFEIKLPKTALQKSLLHQLLYYVKIADIVRERNSLREKANSLSRNLHESNLESKASRYGIHPYKSFR